MRERRGCLLLAGLGNKHVAAALHGAGVRALPPCIETKCFSVTKHPSLFEPRHRGGGGTHAVRLPERAARGNERSANLPAVHGTANLGIESLLAIVYALVAVPWLRWLLREYQVERVWRVVSPIPAICIAFIIFIMPQDPATVLVNRMQRVSIVALLMAMMAMLLLLYQFYRMAQESVRNLTLIQENQMLKLESRRYAQLREYMAQTRRLRHDFRQHLHVIAGLTESGKMEELRAYLKEYESEFVDAHATFCANGAMDAIAGYYAATAAQKNIPLAWQLNLPEKLPMREADLCMVLGNLLENALRASERLPEAMRRVSVICHMLSPAMMGLIVENRYDGQLSRREGKLLSTSHPGFGTGLLSVETVAKKYHGQMTVETENGVFRVNVLLNL